MNGGPFIGRGSRGGKLPRQRLSVRIMQCRRRIGVSLAKRLASATERRPSFGRAAMRNRTVMRCQTPIERQQPFKHRGCNAEPDGHALSDRHVRRERARCCGCNAEPDGHALSALQRHQRDVDVIRLQCGTGRSCAVSGLSRSYACRADRLQCSIGRSCAVSIRRRRSLGCNPMLQCSIGRSRAVRSHASVAWKNRYTLQCSIGRSRAVRQGCRRSHVQRRGLQCRNGRSRAVRRKPLRRRARISASNGIG